MYTMKRLWTQLRSRATVEPFRTETTRATILKYAGVGFVYCLCWVPITFWMRDSDIINTVKKEKCDLRTVVLVLGVVFVSSLLLEQALALKSKRRFQKVLPRESWRFPDDARAPEPGLEPGPGSRIRYAGSLGATARALRAALHGGGAAGVADAAAFLRGAGGRRLLRDAHRGARRFRLLDGRLVRKSRFKHVVFFAASNVCCMVSALAALRSSMKCSLRGVSLNFLEFLSITLLTIIAITTFAGIAEHALLFVTREDFPVTDDEKLLLSLVAANSRFRFSGFKRNKHATYASFAAEGDADVFVHVPEALRVYKNEDTKVYDSGSDGMQDLFLGSADIV